MVLTALMVLKVVHVKRESPEDSGLVPGSDRFRLVWICLDWQGLVGFGPDWEINLIPKAGNLEGRDQKEIKYVPQHSLLNTDPKPTVWEK